MRRRRLLVVLAAVTVLSTVIGTAGFGGTSLQRSVSVSVADDDRAVVSIWDVGTDGTGGGYHGYAQEEPVLDNGSTVNVIVVKNRFSFHTLHVDVDHRDGSPVAVDGEPVTFAPGGVAPIEASVDCNGHTGETTALLVIRAYSEDGTFETAIDYRTSVVCGGPADGEDTADPG